VLDADMKKLQEYLDNSKSENKINSEIPAQSNQNQNQVLPSISSKAAAILKYEVLLENTNFLFDFVMNRSFLARQDSTNEMLKIPVPDDYYNFLKEMPLNDPALLVSHQYGTFINRFEYADPFNDAYPNMIEGSYLEHSLKDWHAKDSIAPALLGTETNLTYEIAKVRTLRYHSQNLAKEDVFKYWDKLKAGITNPSLLEIGERFLATTFREGHETAYELPSGKATEVFKKIIDPYKG